MYARLGRPTPTLQARLFTSFQGKPNVKPLNCVSTNLEDFVTPSSISTFSPMPRG
jgi:hypothetical protein